jgi:hypothetical protein
MHLDLNAHGRPGLLAAVYAADPWFAHKNLPVRNRFGTRAG